MRMHETAVVIVDQLNLRIRPGDDERDIIGTLKRGDRVEVIDVRRGPKAKWLSVRTDAKLCGWIAGRNEDERFVKIEREPGPGPSESNDLLSAIIAWSGVGHCCFWGCGC